MEENIRNWYKEPSMPEPKIPMHRSRHSKRTAPTGSTFGLGTSSRMPGANLGAETGPVVVKKPAVFGPGSRHHSNPKRFLMKTGTGAKSKISQPSKFSRPRITDPKAGVPPPGQIPIMGLTTSKNFIVANAVENILAVPRNVDMEEKRYVGKQDYGKVPDYLGKVKDAIRTEREIMLDYMEMETQSAEGETGQYAMMDQDERETLIHELKLKWDEVNKEYQKNTHNVNLDTINKLRNKERNEKCLADLEKYIDKLERAQSVAIQQ